MIRFLSFLRIVLAVLAFLSACGLYDFFIPSNHNVFSNFFSPLFWRYFGTQLALNILIIVIFIAGYLFVTKKLDSYKKKSGY